MALEFLRRQQLTHQDLLIPMTFLLNGMRESGCSVCAPARRRSNAMEARMRLLPNDDMRRVALHYVGASKSLFATLPQKDTKCSKDECPGVVAVYLGLPDPRIVKVVRALSVDGRIPYFQDAQFLRVSSMCMETTFLYTWARDTPGPLFTTMFRT